MYVVYCCSSLTNIAEKKSSFKMSKRMIPTFTAAAHSHHQHHQSEIQFTPHVTEFPLRGEACGRRIDAGAFIGVDGDTQHLGESRFRASAKSLRTLVHLFSFSKTNASSFWSRTSLSQSPFSGRSSDASDTGIPRFLASVSFRSSVHSSSFAKSFVSNLSNKALRMIDDDAGDDVGVGACCSCRCRRMALAMD
jgi:hypothetical protein